MAACIVSVGANPELINGNINSGNIYPLALSGAFAKSPQSTAIQLIAVTINNNIPAMINQFTKPAWGLKPTMKAVPIITVTVITFRIIDAAV